ncbi:MAG: hypothetical protein KAF24_01505 [Nitrosopumilaceae archaeon]|nr:hypothetical protein [Nitrosopumilaceae archaeon]
MKIICYYTVILLFSIIIITNNAFAHTEVNIAQYNINVGWNDEPPITGFINNVTFEINKMNQTNVKHEVKNAFKNLDAYIKYGGTSKKLNINSLPAPGNYDSKIIPSKPGSYVIELQGKLNDIIIDVDIPIDEVKDNNILSFPQLKISSNENEIHIIKNAISSLRQDLDLLQNNKNNKQNDLDLSSFDMIYDMNILALSLSSAGIILSILAIIKIK